MKNGNKSWDVLGDSRKRYRGLWAEVGKYWPGKEPIRLQDSLPCPLKKIILNIDLFSKKSVKVTTEWCYARIIDTVPSKKIILNIDLFSKKSVKVTTEWCYARIIEKKNRSLIGQINFTFQQMIFCTLTCLNCVWSGSEIKSNQILRLKKITGNNIVQVNFYKQSKLKYPRWIIKNNGYLQPDCNRVRKVMRNNWKDNKRIDNDEEMN